MKKLFLLLAFFIALCDLSGMGQSDINKINNWLIAGPFTTASTNDYLNFPFINEPVAAPLEGELAGDVKWKKLISPFVDFTRQGFGRTSNCAA